ncbi:12760_t:CDS:2 [Gigaspora margarita]|uniref:12760_t:CDS:1 n=1 Tax=Gigaspora margarita TaxID=4874 RepID=A0ABN7UD84_GIGMA|nr:12760_t:CDS:2 [Gigaspora margarita]
MPDTSENGSKTPTSDETHKMTAKCPSAIIPTNDELATTQLQSPKYTILENGSKSQQVMRPIKWLQNAHQQLHQQTTIR